MNRIVESARRIAHAAAIAAAVSTVPAHLGAQSEDAGRSRAASPGSYAAGVARTSATSGGAPASISIEGGARRVLVGATVPHTARVRDASGAERRDIAVRWTSSNPNVASVNQFGVLTAARPGAVTLRAVAGGLSAERQYTVEANPVKSLTLSITADQARTGDVVEVSATAFDANGSRVPNVPFLYTFTAAVEDTAVGQMAPAALDQKGRFVAQRAGDYQIIAVAPGLVAHRTVRVSNRDVGESARLVAKAALGAPLADLFAWQGRDGRRYAVVCTSGSGNRAQLVTFELGDATLTPIDTMNVDAKAITDCVVEDGGLGIAVREGANGRSSLALFDASNPRALKPLGTFDDGIGATSGIAVYKRHVYVVSDARRLDVISVEDPARPRRVGSIDLGAASGGNDAGTDVSVTDGIAYVALGRNGVALVDVGNGKFGGSPAKPVRVGSFRAPFASTHAAYGYRSRTGKWYVVTSEDIGPPDAARGGSSAGLAHPGFARIIDFSDPARPEDVARYEVPEAGVQDLWIENERLYVAGQTGGLRVVDISADLKGNLYHQGREITRFAAVDDGALPNVTAVQPIGGNVLVADRNSGVWMVQLTPRR